MNVNDEDSEKKDDFERSDTKEKLEAGQQNAEEVQPPQKEDDMQSLRQKKADLENVLKEHQTTYEQLKGDNTTLNRDLERANKLNSVLQNQIQYLEKLSSIEHNKMIYTKHQVNTTRSFLMI